MGHRIPRPNTAFSLDPTAKRREGKNKRAGHLRFIRRLPCLACGARWHIEAAHVRYADPEHDKAHSAMGQKPDDRYTVPLCQKHHREQHAGNEREWWRSKGIDPLAVTSRLFEATGDDEAGTEIVSRFGGKR